MLKYLENVDEVFLDKVRRPLLAPPASRSVPRDQVLCVPQAEAVAEMGAVLGRHDPMGSGSASYIDCVQSTRRYIAWAAARGQVFQAYQELALLSQVRGCPVRRPALSCPRVHRSQCSA